MTLLYYATRISENISKREPEGYLICRNVPIARSGTQVYLAEELELDGDGDREIEVIRPEEEVFSKATIASFEGMPLTDDHPDEGVNVDNINYLQVGHVENVRRGTGDERNMLIAELFITNPEVIEKVLSGEKREISCGYNYELSEENGKYYQRQIRGNHIAIVDKGRAGHRVCIKDSFPKKGRRDTMRKEKNSRAGILSRMFAAYARDAEPEEIAEAADTIQEIAAEPVPTDPDEAPKGATEATQQDGGDDVLGTIMERLDAIEARLNSTDEDPEEDPLEKFQSDLDEAAQGNPVPPQFQQNDENEEEGFAFPQDEQDEEEQLESHYADPEVINEQDEDVDEVIAANNNEPVSADCRGRDRRAIDATRAAIRAVKPFINSLPDAQRKKAADALVKSLRKTSGLDASSKSNGYLAIKRARRTADSDKRRQAEKELGDRIMAKRNINAKK